MDRFIAFDLEIARVLPNNDIDHWRAHRPLGLSCAATCDQDGTVREWHSRLPVGTPAPQMTPGDCRQLLDYLVDCQAHGVSVVTWNGTAFDLDVLGEEACAPAVAAALAPRHVDLMAAFTCVQGYRLALDVAAAGCGSHKGACACESGAEAPALWAQGKYAEVLAYVTQDVRATADIARHLLAKHGFQWRTRRGSQATWRLPRGVVALADMTVEKCLCWPEPDTSWMSDPPRRSDFLAWTRLL